MQRGVNGAAVYITLIDTTFFVLPVGDLGTGIQAQNVDAEVGAMVSTGWKEHSV